MRYAIDRIEEDIVVIENIETQEIKKISKKTLPQDIKEGSILFFDNNKYQLDLDEEELRRKKIQERFNRLRKKDV